MTDENRLSPPACRTRSAAPDALLRTEERVRTDAGVPPPWVRLARELHAAA